MAELNPAFLEGLAQLETQGGKKSIKGTNNLYNIKDFSGGGIRARDKAEGSNDAYRVYASTEESTADLLSLLGRKYPKALEAKTGLEFATALKEGGYATDPNYVQKLTAVIASKTGAETHAVEQRPIVDRPLTQPPRMTVQWDTPMPGRVVKADKPEKLVEAVTPFPVIAAPPSALVTGAEAEEAANRADQVITDQTGILDVSKALGMHQMGWGPVMKWVARPNYEPDPGFVIPQKAYDAKTADEQEFVSQAVSQEHLNRIEAEIQIERDDMSTAQRRGIGVNILAGAIAGAPVDFVSGMAGMKLFNLAKVGASQLAAQGRKGAAIASGAVEAGVGAAAVDLTSSAFDTTSSTSEIGMDVAASMLLGGVLNVPGALYGASRAVAEQEAIRLAEQSAQKVLDLRAKAWSNLGPMAGPNQLAAEMRRLEANELRAQQSDATGAVPASRRLFGEDESLRPDSPEAVPEVKTTQELLSEADPNFKWQDAFFLQTRVAAGQLEQASTLIREMTNGKMVDRDSIVSGVQRGQTKAVLADAESVQMKFVHSVVQQIQNKFLPQARIVLTDTIDKKSEAIGPGVRGSHSNYGGDIHIIAIKKVPNDSTAMARTAVHEMGHAITSEYARYIPPELSLRISENFNKFKEDLAAGRPEARRARWSLTGGGYEPKLVAESKYNKSLDEMFAEKFVTFIERDVMGGNVTELPKGFVQNLRAWVSKLLDLFNFSKEKGWFKEDDPFVDFFSMILTGEIRKAGLTKTTPTAAQPAAVAVSKDFATDFTNDTFAAKHGLALLPLDTPMQQAEAQAIRGLYAKAVEHGYKVDEKRLSSLLNTAVFQGAQSTANRMLRSDNPVVRMAAAELLESPSGAAGRRSTASIAAWTNNRAYLGNTLNDYQASYAKYRLSQGENVVGDIFGGKAKTQFDRMVAEEIESRQPGAAAVNSPASVKEAADHLEKAYDRIRIAQTQAKTIGWASLPESSKGYMPHRMSPEKVQRLTVGQTQALHQALMDQFISIEGFDISFSNKLARQYIDSVKTRAFGGFSSPLGIHQVGAADIVEDALQQMGMSQQQITAMMKKYMAGGPGHTKRRLRLDLNQVYGEGADSFKLMDLFTTDQFSLLRSQSQRVAGEVALARHGVMGKPGLKLLRKAMEMGGDGEKATLDEIEAFDQVAAEFMGEPFGTQSKLADRVMQVNSVARLGGMGFTQFAEAINGVFHVGALKAMSTIPSMLRLHGEIKALAAGKQVKNPIIGSIEQYGGAEFGTDAYKTVFPFDNESLGHQTFGAETLSAGDRLLRGASFLQGKLSFWRAIHSAQQRGFAEQVVRKAAGYLKDGGNDAALKDMGMDDALLGRLRKDLNNIATFNNGSLTDFDISKATDKEAATEFVQAIHRGVSQIIQGTFIGETGKWSHDGMMRIMTQFRTFSLTSVEKQWNRQVGNVGNMQAFGMLLGAMSMAAPIYMARTYLASIGKADQDAYLEKQLAPERIARATLNYIAMAGLAGEFIDAASAITGVTSPTGGRSGVASDFVGTVVAPAAGLADDAWKSIQDTKEGTDPFGLLKNMPFSKLPYLTPLINGLQE